MASLLVSRGWLGRGSGGPGHPPFPGLPWEQGSRSNSGTGEMSSSSQLHSSDFNYLRDFRVSEVRVFPIVPTCSSPRQQHLHFSLLASSGSHKLGFTTVGCHYLSGFLREPPLPSTELTKLPAASLCTFWNTRPEQPQLNLRAGQGETCALSQQAGGQLLPNPPELQLCW